MVYFYFERLFFDIVHIRSVFLCGLLCAVCSVSVLAVPAKQGVRSYVQPDGTVISLRLIGDEYFHALVTEDGLAVSRDNSGVFRYMTVDGSVGMAVHNPGERTVSERNYVASLGDRISFSSLVRSRRDAVNAARKARAPRRVGTRNRQVPCVGSPRIPILLVQYKDYKFKDADANATFTQFFCDGDKSALRYFTDQSNGKFTPEFDIYGPYTLPSNRVVYGGNDIYGNDKGVGRMVGEGCLGLNAQVDFSRYDNDGDGECDVVIVLYAGDGEASSYEDDFEDSVWPCQWDLASSDYGKSLSLDGTKVNKFAVFNELNGLDLTKIDGVGTFCHEFSHCIDLPDFYDTDYNGHFGMGPWSLMDYGSYNDDGYTPVGYTAYEKWFMGWIDIPEAAENTRYTLPVSNSGADVGDVAVKLTNPRDADEYFIIENRANQGWDKYMAAEGLLITHVTYDASAWMNNVVNNYTLQRMTPVPADNSLKVNRYNIDGEVYYEVDEASLKGDLWPYAGNNELTDSSVPAAKVNTGSYLGKPVTEMACNNDGTISFWVMKGAVEKVSSPVNVGHEVESSTSATIYWEAGDDNDVTYTLELFEHKDIAYTLISETDFDDSAHGWSSDGYTVAGTSGGIRLGSSNRSGSLTSPSFTLVADGVVTVILDAEQYSDSENIGKVSLLSDGSVLKSETLSLTEDMSRYAVVFSDVSAGGPLSVKIETVSSKKRFAVRYAAIYAGDASALLDATVGRVSRRLAHESGDEYSRTVEGISGLSYTVSGLKSGGCFDYRVKAVPCDSENYGESAWCKAGVLDLSQPTGISCFDSEMYGSEDEYFTLEGVRVDGADLAPGVYIRVSEGVTEKIMVR